MANEVNSALWGSMAHREGSLGRTRRALDYIGEVGGPGGLSGYDPARAYGEDDVVIKDDKIYVANDTIPAGTTFATGTAGATWTEVSSATGDIVIANHDSGSDYGQNEVVVRNGVLQRAKNSVTGGGTDNDWEDIESALAHQLILKAWIAGKYYKRHSVIYADGGIWRANSNRPTSVAAFDVTEKANWESLGGEGGIALYDNTKDYTKDDVVIYNKLIYIANDNVPNGTTFTTGTTGATWSELSRSIFRGVFDTGEKYNVKDVVVHNNTVWEANIAINSGSAFNPIQWTAILESFTIEEWSALTYYPKGSIAIEGGVPLIRKADGTSRASYDASENSQWDVFVTNSIIPDYTASATYKQRQVVCLDNVLYRANEDIASAPGVMDTTKWTAITDYSVYRGNFDDKVSYRVGQMVTYENNLRVCNTAVNADPVNGTAWDNAKWDFVLYGAIHRGSFVTNVDYYPDNIVHFEGRDLKCTTAHRGAFDKDNFEPADIKTVIDFSNTLTVVYPNERIYYLGTLYKANAEVTAFSAAGDLPNASSDYDVYLYSGIKGEHSATAIYKKDDIVIKNARLWRANGDIATPAAFVSGTGATEWSELSASADMTAPDWQMNTEYIADAIVFQGNKLYRNSSGAALTSGATWDSTEEARWTEIKATSATVARLYTDAEDYVQYELTYHDGEIWRAKNAITNTPAVFDETKWEQVTGGAIIVDDYQDGIAYAKNEIIREAGRIWRCKAALATSPAAFDESQWEVVQDVIVFRNWAANTAFMKDEVVVQDGYLYRALNDRPDTVTAWDATEQAEWENVYCRTNIVIRDYDGGEVYFKNELTYNNEIIYMALNDIANTPAIFDETQWKVIAKRQTFRGNYDSVNAYRAGDIVARDNVLLEADSDIAANSSFDATQWTIVQSETGIDDWTADKYYAKGQLAKTGGTILSRVTAGWSLGTFDATEQAEWVVFQTPTVIREYVENETYYTNELVLRDDGIWKALEDIELAPAAVDTTKWDRIIGTASVIREFQANEFYKTGDTALYQNHLWELTAASGTFSSFDAADWSVKLTDGTVKAWQANFQYQLGQAAVIGGIIMRRIATGVSGASIDAAELANWVPFCRNATVREYVNGRTYYTSEIIRFDEALYHVTATFTATTAEPDSSQVSVVTQMRGEWEGSTSYYATQYVINDGKLYCCNTDHTSDVNTFMLDIANWDLIGSAGGIEDWEASTYYAQNAVCLYDGQIYYRTSAGTSDATWAADSADWRHIQASPNIRVWDDSAYYRLGESILYEGDKILRALVDGAGNDGAGGPKPDEWFVIGERNVVSVGYRKERNYAKDNVVMHEDSWYIANADILPNAVGFQPAEWRLLEGSAFIAQWQASTAYKQRQVVEYESRILRCTSAGGHTSNATFDSAENAKWEVIAESGKLKGQYAQGVTYYAGDIVYGGNSVFLANTTHVGGAVFDAAATADFELLLVGSSYYLTADQTIVFPVFTAKGTSYIVEEDYTAPYLGFQLKAGMRLELKADKEASASLADINDFWVYQNIDTSIPKATSTLTGTVGFGTPSKPGTKFPANVDIDVSDSLWSWGTTPPADLTAITVVDVLYEGDPAMARFTVTGPTTFTMDIDLLGEETIEIIYGI